MLVGENGIVAEQALCVEVSAKRISNKRRVRRPGNGWYEEGGEKLQGCFYKGGVKHAD